MDKSLDAVFGVCIMVSNPVKFASRITGQAKQYGYQINSKKPKKRASGVILLLCLYKASLPARFFISIMLLYFEK